MARLHALAGRPTQALETIEDAIRIVDDTGERLHLPELLRSRALYRGKLAVAHASRVDDLLEALRMADSQDSTFVASRDAEDIAALRLEVRPGNWRHRLEAAQGRLPATRPHPELTEDS